MPRVSAKIVIRMRSALRRRGQAQIRLLRLSGAHIGPRVTFNAPVFIVGPAQNLVVGARTVINELVLVNCRGGVQIGSDCHVSSGAQILSTKLTSDGAIHSDEPVIIGDRVWIAAGAVVGPGVTIADDCVVGANSVVLRHLKIAGLYVGAPATLVRTRLLGDNRSEVEAPMTQVQGDINSGQ